MAWLARLDRRSASWFPPVRVVYRVVKYSLLALGAYLWVALWFERHWLLGVLQLGLMAHVLREEVIASRSADSR